MHIIDLCIFLFFFFNDTATTEIYTLSLHDALPILSYRAQMRGWKFVFVADVVSPAEVPVEMNAFKSQRSEEHTSELQSHSDLVCRLLLEKKKKKKKRQDKRTLYNT